MVVVGVVVAFAVLGGKRGGLPLLLLLRLLPVPPSARSDTRMDSGRGCFWAFCSSCVAEAEDEAKRSDEEFRVVFVFVVVDDVLVDASAGSGEPPAAAALSLPRSFWSSLDPRPWNFNLNAPRREEAGRGAEASPLSSSHSTEATPGSIFFFFFASSTRKKGAFQSSFKCRVTRSRGSGAHSDAKERQKCGTARARELSPLFEKEKNCQDQFESQAPSSQRGKK